jgi:hypothetical protein
MMSCVIRSIHLLTTLSTYKNNLFYKFQAKKSKKEEKKMVTVDKELLLAASYFDLGHCGYFEPKDLVKILFNLGPIFVERSSTKERYRQPHPQIWKRMSASHVHAAPATRPHSWRARVKNRTTLKKAQLACSRKNAQLNVIIFFNVSINFITNFTILKQGKCLLLFNIRTDGQAFVTGRTLHTVILFDLMFELCIRPLPATWTQSYDRELQRQRCEKFQRN